MSEKQEDMTVNKEEQKTPLQAEQTSDATNSDQEAANSNTGEEPKQEQSEKESAEKDSAQTTAGDDKHEFGEAEDQDPIELLEKELVQEKERYLRLYADFENFRRRTAKERIELIDSASGDIMKEILPVLDDFERAVQSNKEATDIESVKAGFELLHNKLFKLLSNKGLKPIESKGETFDSEMHEAIAQIPAPTEDQKGKVIDVVEQGYQLGDKIIRHPKVVVGT